jgi:hypothetical protein
MEKLEKYGVQEMNAVEMREVDGGNAPLSVELSAASLRINK